MRVEVEAHALLVAKHLFGMQTSGEGQRRHVHAERSVQLPSTSARRSCGNVLAAADPWTASARLLPPNHGRITS